MRRRQQITRAILATVVAIAVGLVAASQSNLEDLSIPSETPSTNSPVSAPRVVADRPAAVALETLPVKGRAAKTDYSRSQFGSGWTQIDGCDARNAMLQRDLTMVTRDRYCRVLTGQLVDPYTGVVIQFERGEVSSQLVQIDHVVALSNAWQTGAQQLSPEQRVAFANDPLELLAVDGSANQQKSDSDAASWLPANKSFRCSYVARQIAVKQKYSLWVTPPEKMAMQRVLSECPAQLLPSK